MDGKERKKQERINSVNDFIDLKMLEVNENLNMYFDNNEPFYGYYDPDEGSNSGIIINVRTNSSELKKIFSNFPSQVHDDRIMGENKIFKEMLEKRCEFFEQFDTTVYWRTYYDAATNSFKTIEKIYYSKCIVNGKGVSKKIENIEKDNPTSEKLKKILKKEKIKKIYNIVDTEMFEFIDGEIERLIEEFLKTNKLEIDEKINQVITEAIEQIKQIL
jgi:hypothetical protein